jgi:hypothetical protein
VGVEGDSAFGDGEGRGVSVCRGIDWEVVCVRSMGMMMGVKLDIVFGAVVVCSE